MSNKQNLSDLWLGERANVDIPVYPGENENFQYHFHGIPKPIIDYIRYLQGAIKEAPH